MFSVLMRQHLGGLRLGAGVAALAGAVALSSVSEAANRTRQYDFEDGVAGQTTTTATDSIDIAILTDLPPLDGFPPLNWVEVPGGAGRPLPAGGLMDSVNSVALTDPPLNSFNGSSATYVDVSVGSGLELPETNRTESNIALRFDGNTAFEDFDPETGNVGSRGVFFSEPGFAANDDVAGGTNTFESFTLITQAWVWPDPAAEGARQVVYQAGVEHGAVAITEEGTWTVENLGGAGPIETDVDVNFGEWNHVAVLRTGGSAELYVNGFLSGTGSGFFGTFAGVITLGGAEFGIDPFTGLVDNFLVLGTGDLQGFDPIRDLDVDVSPPPGGCDFNLDGNCDQADYDIWAANVGFDNGFGAGDLSTFQLGDDDLNGRVDFFDLRGIIEQAAAQGNAIVTAEIPEPTAACLLALAGVTAAAANRGRKVQ